MSVEHPVLIAVAVLVGAACAVGLRRLHRERTRAYAAAGVTARGGLRRWLPPVLFLAAVVFLLLAVARPQVTLGVPRTSGTVMLAFDVSNSMGADDIAPNRLAAAQNAAIAFVEAQPDTVDIGVIAFSQGALSTHEPGNRHAETVDAIKRLRVTGGTSLGQAILGSLTAIVGRPVLLPEPPAPPPDVGYHADATIVLLTDGEDTGGPDVLQAAELASNAGVHIQTVGVGTVEGSTVDIDGYQVATALNEDLLTQVATATGGAYHRAADAGALDAAYRDLDLRTTIEPRPVELTGPVVAFALLLLVAGAVLTIHWFGRIV
ncbi:VWA domain-containing protein [Asanoa sp. WMMD1127]|uniref:VWA domain-containing protein n=1 Tax=Asanoa sp. WMMD1127 TaxID=3016107 RepID=UPI002417A3C7|nr:VWA domain-containing protein [Asanoa sp. WMMD1127]MDG4825473.1 VWA domain-containing protein [Asanoa sp. WMMD1127]